VRYVIHSLYYLTIYISCTGIAQKVISDTNSFLSGMNIMEGVVVFHEMHWKRLNGVILKIDFMTFFYQGRI
jgi:hypothetical protein